MTMTDQGAAAPLNDAPAPRGLRTYCSGIAAVFGMELRQRLRSRGWYIMLGIWFVIIGLVTALTWSSVNVQNSIAANDGMIVSANSASMIFEIVLAFVLLFALLVAPALSANAVNGDRASGTLAILQVTLLRPGQILWGKFLASWIAGLTFLIVSVPFLVFAILQGNLGLGQIVVSIVMLAVEIGVVCALGVGISALANRPLFSIVVTYLVVAALTVGTLIAFGLGMMVSQGTVAANQQSYKNSFGYGAEYNPPGEDTEVRSYNDAPRPKDVTDENDQYFCHGPFEAMPAPRTDRVAWILGMNPFVVVADAIPYPVHTQERFYSTGVIESISQAARYAQAGPQLTYPCAGGKVAPDYLDQKTPLWPLGLGLQLLVTAGLLTLGWRALRTPAKRLAQGTRIA